MVSSNVTRLRALLAAGVLAGLCLTPSARAEERPAPEGQPLAQPATQPATPANSAAADLAAEVKALRDQVHELQDSQKDLKQQLQQQSERENQDRDQRDDDAAKEIAAKILQDAGHRSQLTEIGELSAGFSGDQGFFVRSEDGNFLLHPWFMMQVRDVTNYRQDAKGNDRDDTQNGFEIRRMQLGADGNAFTPDLTYRIFIQTERSGGEAELFNAFVKYHLPGTAWSILGGQFKAPFDHEQLISDRLQLSADRTLVDDILARGEAFSEGVSVVYDPGDAFRAQMDFTNGYGANNVNFEEPPSRSSNFGIGGRAEYKVFGNWRDYEHFTSLDSNADLLVVGGGVDWTQSGHSAAIRHVVDAQWNIGSLGLYAAYLGMYTSAFTPASTTTTPAPAITGDTYDSSIRLQASYLIPSTRWEPFARYDYLHLDGREFTPGTHASISEFTLGVNYYLHHQNAKFTLDLLYLPTGSPVDDNGSGVLVDNGHGELILRGQMQLAL